MRLASRRCSAVRVADENMGGFLEPQIGMHRFQQFELSLQLPSSRGVIGQRASRALLGRQHAGRAARRICRAVRCPKQMRAGFARSRLS